MGKVNNKINFQCEIADTNYYYEYDKSLPLKDQIIDSHDGFYLLNVRKIFTNNTYFGVKFSILNSRDNYITHSTYCKDRGFTEEKVNTQDGFFSVRSKKYIFNLAKHIETEVEFTYKRQDIEYPPINGRTFSIYFAYDDLHYKSTTYVFDDNKGVVRGLYGVSQEQFDTWDLVKSNKESHVLHDTTPSKEQLDEFYKKTVISLSNNIQEINTDYSKIKIFR